MARTKTVRKRTSTVKEQIRLQKVKFAPISKKSKSKARKGLSTASKRTNKRRFPMSTMSRPKQPEVVAEVDPEIQLNVEIQAEAPQPTPREELVASLHPLPPDMPTGEEFLSGWTSVVQGGTSTPSIISAVTSMTVTAGEMQQLISTPGIQVTTIPITIPLASVMEVASISIQSQLWIEGQQPEADNEERVVEVELDKEQGGLQEEQGGTQKGSQEEKESDPRRVFRRRQ